jgi:DNA-binding CsgD family transcriptional regulator
VIIERAPAVLCRASGFRRALVSVVRDSAIVPQAASFVDDPAGAREALTRLGDEPIQLEHPLIETELLRRRRAVLVADAHADHRAEPRLAAVMGWSSYVAAPVLRGGAVIGMVHADRGPTERLETLDMDVVSEFADGLSRAYESAVLRRTLQQEQAQMRDFLEWLGARSGVLSDAPITLADEPAAAPSPADGPASEPSRSRDDRLVFDGLLTKRELDVLRLLVDGNTNKAIADALVLSDTTIKFHVNSILRKLHVANRAEAASRYLTLLGVTPP